ncbi:glycosyltransferase family 25 protein [Actimicrobium antarcticum]|uniref:Glycosyltransferase family 25 protein n=1 Tax=Actimicrobium antarcticum TaxID=1051899 RepID=A0ABP7TFW5_9BURK
MMAGTIPIYCISLSDQLARREYMRLQFERFGLPYAFFDAIRISTEADVPAIYNRKARLRFTGRELRPGEMGCYLSHQAVWARFLQTAEKACLILEDDVEFHPDFAEVVQSLCDTSSSWDFVRLFGVFKCRYFPVKRILGQHFLVSYLKQPNGMQGYLINRYAATVLLQYTASMVHPIDVAIDRDWEHRLNLMGIEPACISHIGEFATTLGAQDRSRLPLRTRLARELHRAGTLHKKLWWRACKRVHLLLRGS